MKENPCIYSCECIEPSSTPNEGSINIIGIPFDGTACFRKGTKEGPEDIRKYWEDIEFYSPYLNASLEDFPKVFDLGDLEPELAKNSSPSEIDHELKHTFDHFEKTFKDINLKKDSTQILTLGGEHSISLAPIKKYLNEYEDLIILHLDAHADLRDGFEGHHYSHASIMRRCLDFFEPNHQLIQYGIRSGTKEEFQWMHENQTIKESRSEFLKAVKEIDNERPIYLTLDLDYFDPSFFPGTGTPEAGGEDFHSFVSLMKILKDKNFVGADVVELSPQIDQTGNSSVFATKVCREILIGLAQSKGRNK